MKIPRPGAPTRPTPALQTDTSDRTACGVDGGAGAALALNLAAATEQRFEPVATRPEPHDLTTVVFGTAPPEAPAAELAELCPTLLPLEFGPQPQPQPAPLPVAVERAFSRLNAVLAHVEPPSDPSMERGTRRAQQLLDQLVGGPAESLDEEDPEDPQSELAQAWQETGNENEREVAADAVRMAPFLPHLELHLAAQPNLAVFHLAAVAGPQEVVQVNQPAAALPGPVRDAIRVLQDLREVEAQLDRLATLSQQPGMGTRLDKVIGLLDAQRRFLRGEPPGALLGGDPADPGVLTAARAWWRILESADALLVAGFAPADQEALRACDDMLRKCEAGRAGEVTFEHYAPCVARAWGKECTREAFDSTVRADVMQAALQNCRTLLTQTAAESFVRQHGGSLDFTTWPRSAVAATCTPHRPMTHADGTTSMVPVDVLQATAPQAAA